MKARRPRKLTIEKAARINRRRDLIEGEPDIEYDRFRVRSGRGMTINENNYREVENGRKS